MTEVKKTFLYHLLSLLIPACVSAQKDNFGIWTNIETKTKILPDLEATVEGDFRTRDDWNTIDRWSFSGGLSYRLWSFLKVGGDYDLIRFNHAKRGWETGHRYSLYTTGSYQWDQVSFSLREKYQHTYRKGVPATNTRANPKDELCSRLKISYHIHKSCFTPYASVELFHKLNDPQSNGLDEIRYTIGTEYELNKNNSLRCYYLYQDNKDDGSVDMHILGIGYSIKF